MKGTLKNKDYDYSVGSNALDDVKMNNPLIPSTMPTYSGLATLKPREALTAALDSSAQPSMAAMQFNKLMDQNMATRAVALRSNPLAARSSMLSGSQATGGLMGTAAANYSQEQQQRQQEMMSMIDKQIQANNATTAAANSKKQQEQSMWLNLIGAGASAAGLAAAL